MTMHGRTENTASCLGIGLRPAGLGAGVGAGVGVRGRRRSRQLRPQRRASRRDPRSPRPGRRQIQILGSGEFDDLMHMSRVRSPRGQVEVSAKPEQGAWSEAERLAWWRALLGPELGDAAVRRLTNAPPSGATPVRTGRRAILRSPAGVCRTHRKSRRRRVSTRRKGSSTESSP